MIAWISVGERVPSNRRVVLTWGRTSFLGMFRESVYCGETKYNRGQGFDNERFGGSLSRVITHWAELEGPAS